MIKCNQYPKKLLNGFKDRFGRFWRHFSITDLCLVCGQPDFFRVCPHTKLSNIEALTLMKED